MKRILICILIASCLFAMLSASAETLHINGVDNRTQIVEGPDSVHEVSKRWYTEWNKMYPNVKLVSSYKLGFQNTAALLKGLQKKNASNDVLVLSTASYDMPALMREGALRSLSGNHRLLDMIADMHPAFQAAARYDDQLYAIPCSVSFSFLSYHEEARILAGYSKEEMPRSFTGLLDFLEQWAERCATDPVKNVCVTNEFNEETYRAESYTVYLAELLLKQYIQQCAAQDIACRFHTPEMVALLERIAQLGPKLYQVDDSTGQFCFINNSSEPRYMAALIPGRLTENDPVFIPAQVEMLCISASSKHQDAAVAFAEMYMNLIRNREFDLNNATTEDTEAALAKALLFADASGDVINDHYPWYEQYLSEIIHELEAIVADPSQSKSKKEKAQERLTRYGEGETERAETIRKAMYQLTADELADYQTWADFFRVTSYDLSIISSKKTDQLLKQFALGSITADELLKRLDAQH